MRKILRRLSSVALRGKVLPVLPSKWQLSKQENPVGERKDLVESIDRSLKPNLKTFPRILAVAATPSGKDIESQICDLKNIWSHLLLTYGLKDECLQRFLSHHTKQTAGQLPQCKLVVVRKLPEELQMMAEKRYLNHHFIRFVSDRGVVVDPAREPDEYPEMHQLVVDFGRSVCEQYPLIFRDLYLYHARDNRDAISEMQRRQNLKDPGPRQKFDHCMTLLDYVQKKKNLESWYCFNDEFYTQLRDCQFTFIRSLGEKPFDPIAMSNVIDPEVQFKAWEHAGLLAAAPVQFQLDVKNGALPSPIINEIKHGALASGMG